MLDDEAKINQTKWQVSFPYGDTYYFFTEFGARQWLANRATEGFETDGATIETIESAKKRAARQDDPSINRIERDKKPYPGR